MPKFNHTDDRISEGESPSIHLPDTKQKAADPPVKKRRRTDGRPIKAKKKGTGLPNTLLEDRTIDELQNRASELQIDGRSDMDKQALINAIRTALR
ncbi:hypothetical protein K227x_06120 [Rubripirellula lacrimiformis]|uniref:Uncharacterized protein n=2 Tax=Rubripirellula lacrimiformis TaxID=1930273 RepID=A0A517N524_9BACT|nr:hypothetical protein K227x_06120 [Rubripirellula lacrimiformis]